MQIQWQFYPLALFGSLCFAILFRTPVKYMPLTVLIGFIACVGIHTFPADWHVGYTSFIMAMAIGSISHVFARITKAPAQCFLIPGVIFLVPGTYLYRAFSAGMAQDINTVATTLFTAIIITLGISSGLLVANWIVPSRQTL